MKYLSLTYDAMVRFVSVLLLSAVAVPVFSRDTVSRSFERDIRTLLAGKRAAVGVAVSAPDGRMLTVGGHRRYPLLSVFKFHQALAVLDYLARNGLSPEKTLLPVGSADLPSGTYSPLRDERPGGGFDLSVGELLRYSVSLSDNNACDILFRYAGGPRTVHRYVRRLGFRDVLIRADEAKMHRRCADQRLNRSKPASVAALLALFLETDLLPSPYRAFLEKTMIETSTGTDKLRAGLPPGTVLGHKTGSSDRNRRNVKIADNDAGFVRLPDGSYYYIAVFVKNSRETDAVNASLIAGISRAVYDYFVK